MHPLKYFRSMLSRTGDDSSKRFFAAWCFAIVTVYIFTTHPADALIVTAFLSAGTGLLGISAFTKQ
jgi:hypothetical protein